MNNESLCTFRVMKVDEIKRNKGTQDGNVKSKVMGEDLSCGIKPSLQKHCNLCVSTLMIFDQGYYTSVDKSLRHCERFDTSTYLQDHPHLDMKGGNLA
jgi:hypothetical protein